MGLNFGIQNFAGSEGLRKVYTFTGANFVHFERVEAAAHEPWIDNDNGRIKSESGATTCNFILPLNFPAGTKIISACVYSAGNAFMWDLIRYDLTADGNLHIVTGIANNALGNLSIVMEEQYCYGILTQSITNTSTIRGAWVEIIE